MMYKLLQKLLFALPPETSHTVALQLLKLVYQLKLLPGGVATQACQHMGLTFPNRIGLAAGLDKNGDYYNALGALGFGFVEVGTVTPKPQVGNSKPRLFRLPEAQAIINRLGFNNKGVDYLVERLKERRFQGVLGVNIGKNKDSQGQQAIEDYLIAFTKVYPYADYVTVNISSPNTVGLRDMQHGEQLEQLLTVLKQRQQALRLQHKKYVPLLVKIAPELDHTSLSSMAETIVATGIEGVIATNTTVSRQSLCKQPYWQEAGGLSGAPLKKPSTVILTQLKPLLADKATLLGVGGIMSAEDAWAKFAAGAQLVQIYSGLVYQGPGLVKALVNMGE